MTLPLSFGIAIKRLPPRPRSTMSDRPAFGATQMLRKGTFMGRRAGIARDYAFLVGGDIRRGAKQYVRCRADPARAWQPDEGRAQVSVAIGRKGGRISNRSFNYVLGR